MTHRPATLDADPSHPLKLLWDAGPAGWNNAMTKPYVLVPFFIVAAAFPSVLQYIEDNSSWTGAQFWTFLLANCAMYAGLAVALNLVVGYAGLLTLRSVRPAIHRRQLELDRRPVLDVPPGQLRDVRGPGGRPQPRGGLRGTAQSRFHRVFWHWLLHLRAGRE